jgi:DNA-binding winged helix-turn-helix (wHTH) protein/cytochrome c-type biogenesis protein CcmH/NrfG
MPAGGGFVFGHYQLDLRAKCLLRAGQPVTLTKRQLDVLGALVSSAGSTIPHDQLIHAAWGDVAVSDNSLAQIVSQLRSVLDADDPDRYITNSRGRGYRFIAPVDEMDAALVDAELDAMLAPYRVLMDGRAALETLEREPIAKARAVFEHVIVRHGSQAGFHIGLANACILRYESTRADLIPDTSARPLALEHARIARRLNPDSGEAWATLGFVLERTGAREDAVAALRRAVELEPDNWRHHLRLASASWGEERLRAARRTIVLMGECPLAYLLAATVYVARGALAEAERNVDAGLAALRPEGTASSPLTAVALHWLKGLLYLARGDEGEAREAFEQELALEPRGQLYARECCANTWYAIGAIHLRRGETFAARDAFEQAIARVPRHPMAHVGLMLLGADGADDAPRIDVEPVSVDLALAHAASRVALGDASGAAMIVTAALEAAPAGNAGWLVPVEPLLNVQHDRTPWMPALAVLRGRAS